MISDRTEKSFAQKQIPSGGYFTFGKRVGAAIGPVAGRTGAAIGKVIVIISIQIHAIRSGVEPGIAIVVPQVFSPPGRAEPIIHNIFIALRVHHRRNPDFDAVDHGGYFWHHPIIPKQMIDQDQTCFHAHRLACMMHAVIVHRKLILIHLGMVGNFNRPDRQTHLLAHSNLVQAGDGWIRPMQRIQQVHHRFIRVVL